jgi:TolB-like protein/tetratricopeptide (TPR) repeat protein
VRRSTRSPNASAGRSVSPRLYTSSVPLGGVVCLDTFLERLKQRKMVQWALTYLAGAFALIQVVDVISQQFGWPGGFSRGVTIVLAVGFFITLVLAWYHGERGAQYVAGTELLIVALLLAIGGGLLWWFAQRPYEPVKQAATTPATDVATGTAKSATATSSPALPIRDKSIAVLPFDNLSEEKSNAYFASGMRDEILTRLAGIRDLKVSSRSSTEQYASHPADIKTVADQLGVVAVLEGSVQKAGDSVHITVQLIDARTDAHLWAESYDGDLKEIFRVERDVAEKVAAALKATLLPEDVERVARVPTQNSDAYDLYLRALVHYNRANDQYVLTPVEIPRAIPLFQQALAKDPGFALAAAALANAHMYMYWFGPDRTDARLAAAKTATEQALASQPNLGEAHFALARYALWGHRGYAAARQQLQLARNTLPNDADVELLDAAIARRQGQRDVAIAGIQRAIAFNPRSSTAYYNLGQSNMQWRRYAESDKAYARAVELTADPDTGLVRRGQNTVYWKGDVAPLRAAVASLKPGTDAYTANGWRIFQAAWWSRNYAAAAKFVEGESAGNWYDETNLVVPKRLCLAWIYTALGDDAKAKTIYAELRELMRAALLERPDDPEWHMNFGLAAAGLGLKDEAIAEGRKAAALIPVSRDALSGPGYLGRLAQIYARVGENDQAIDLIRQLLAMPAGLVMSPALLRIDPVWDPLRSDARFTELINVSEVAAETK